VDTRWTCVSESESEIAGTECGHAAERVRGTETERQREKESEPHRESESARARARDSKKV
jgi:hypothetical protein